MDLEGKWKPILIGGVITGFAPFVPFLKIACCLIPILGAVVAVAVYRRSHPSALTNSDGLVLGAMSGAVGAGIYAVLVVPVTLLLGGVIGGFLGEMTTALSEVPEPARSILRLFFSHLGVAVGVVLFFKVMAQLTVSVIFGLLGGILGVALLKSR